MSEESIKLWQIQLAEKAAAKERAEEERKNLALQQFNAHLNWALIDECNALALTDSKWSIKPHYEDGKWYINKYSYFPEKTRGTNKKQDPVNVAKWVNREYESAKTEIEAEHFYINCSWIHVLNGWIHDYVTRIVFQDKKGHVYILKPDHNDYDIYDIFTKLKEEGVPADVELVGVETKYEENRFSTFMDTKVHYYVSLSSSANEEAQRILGYNPEKIKSSPDFWGKINGIVEINQDMAIAERPRYLIEGMNKWFYNLVVYYATD